MTLEEVFVVAQRLGVDAHRLLAASGYCGAPAGAGGETGDDDRWSDDLVQISYLSHVDEVSTVLRGLEHLFFRVLVKSPWFEDPERGTDQWAIEIYRPRSPEDDDEDESVSKARSIASSRPRDTTTPTATRQSTTCNSAGGPYSPPHD